MRNKDLTTWGVVDLGQWNVTIVLPLEQASILAGLITEGQVFRQYVSGQGEGYTDLDDNCRGPQPPRIEVITSRERADRYDRGNDARELRKLEAQATNVVQLGVSE